MVKFPFPWIRKFPFPWFGAASLLVLGLAALYRFSTGLGASTNLTDAFPWGLWIGFDVLIGVATTAGGFTIAFVVYILRRHEFHGLARGAVLTAFLGYNFVGAALLFDLGQPFRLWHPMIFWNLHSVMFEVAWCVMLYSSVLAVEFAPEALGAIGFEEWGRKIHKAMPILAGAGVCLSMLHQSSLGTLYLIVPQKLHEFWYTPWLPVLFFFTAIQCGLAMVILEASLSHSILGFGYERIQLNKIGTALLWILSINLGMRGIDLWFRGVDLTAATYERSALGLEIILGWIAPILMLALTKTRTPARLFQAAVLAVVGVILHRLNVAVTGMERAAGAMYWPSLTEIAVTVGLAGVGISVFAMIARFVDLAPREPGPSERLVDGFSGVSLAAVAALLLVVFLSTRNADALAWGRHGDATRPVATEAQDTSVYLRTVVISETHAVRFLHAQHPGDCQECHDGTLSVLTRSDTDYSHEDGFCKRCHDGALTFAMGTRCDACHDVANPRALTIRRGGGSPGAVRFDHEKHAAREISCAPCHPDFPIMSKPSRTHRAMERGEYCGSCHGRGARPAFARCGDCHRLSLPAAYAYPVGPQSPGVVRFRHESHVRVAANRCDVCHEGNRLDPVWRDVTMETMAEGRMCGRCHGEHPQKGAFGYDACESCHES